LPISAEEIEELKKLLEVLSEFVEKSTIPNELKVFVLVQLEELRRGIFDYKIHGAKGFRTAVESVLGTTITQNTRYQEIMKNDGDVLTRLGRFLDRVDEIMSKALKVKKALGNGAKLLGLPWLSENNDE